MVSCSLSRLVGSPVWDLGPLLVLCSSCSSLVFCRVLFSGHARYKPTYIHMMRQSPAHTRMRTLQERLGTQQNGSTGVRSTGRHAEEVNPDQQQNGDEDNVEDDYFNELSSP